MKYRHARVFKGLSFSEQINSYGKIYSVFDVVFQTRFLSYGLFCRGFKQMHSAVWSSVSRLSKHTKLLCFPKAGVESYPTHFMRSVQNTKQTSTKLKARFTGFRDLLKESASRIQEQWTTECITWYLLTWDNPGGKERARDKGTSP